MKLVEPYLPGIEEWLTEELRNHSPDWLAEATVDREQALVRNVALLGAESRNGYRYTAEAMQQAAPLYEGKPVFVDHGPGPQTLEDSRLGVKRSIRDYAGQVVSPRYVEGRVRGDLHLAGPNTSWLLDLIAATPRDIGMSHVVLARRVPGSQEVEKIEQVLSVDIVAFPATTSSFQESGQSSVARGQLSVATDNGQLTADEQRRLLTLLEAYGKHLCDIPLSFEKTSPDGQWSVVSRPWSVATDHGRRTTDLFARQALIAAIRGDDKVTR
jgi:hypothetical protein